MSKIKVSSHGIRQCLGMSQSEFARTFDIPLGTVRNWDSKSCMPYYVFLLFSLLIYYVDRECINNMNKIDELDYMFNGNENENKNGHE